MTYEERYENQVIERGWRAAAGLFSLMLDWLGLTSLNGVHSLHPGQRCRILKPLLRAEAIVRRLLLILALRIKPPTKHQRLQPPKKTERGVFYDKRPDGTPHFRLTEPWPSTTPYDERRRRGLAGPRLSGFDRDGLWICSEPQPATARPNAEMRLIRRLRAVQAVIHSPDKALARMVRWLHHKPRRRDTPLRLGAPPGRLPKRMRDPARDVLSNTHHFALAALIRRDTS